MRHIWFGALYRKCFCCPFMQCEEILILLYTKIQGAEITIFHAESVERQSEGRLVCGKRSSYPYQFILIRLLYSGK